MQDQERRKLQDLRDRRDRKNIVTHSDFLSPEEAAEAETHFRGEGDSFLLHGGFEGAEKRAAFFLPDWMDPGSFDPGEYLAAVEVRPADRGAYTHRDYLGSLMALGVRREKFGDIVVLEDRAVVLCFPEMVRYLEQNMERISRTRAACRRVPLEEVSPPQKEVEEYTATVPSLRADAVLSAAFRLSRGRAAEQIISGTFTVNHLECLKPDRQLDPGDLLGLRGHGRVRLEEVSGTSRKGRLVLRLSRER